MINHQKPTSFMPEHASKNPILVVVGPTAIGKSDFALSIAKRFKGEIVNGDSRQIYRSMGIGTGAPSKEQMQKVPHHLYGIMMPDQEFNLPQYIKTAKGVIDGIHARGNLPVLVGGTGQYIWGLLENWKSPEVEPDQYIRKKLTDQAQTLGPQQVHEILQKVDPVSAQRIDPRNVRRVIRALEVFYKTGVPFSKSHGRGKETYANMIIGLTTSRKQLYRLIELRIESMLASGWIDEVRQLLANNYSTKLSSFSSIGFREIAAWLEEQTPIEQLIEQIAISQHRLVRNQYTWFKLDDPRITWIRTDQEFLIPPTRSIKSFLSTFHAG